MKRNKISSLLTVAMVLLFASASAADRTIGNPSNALPVELIYAGNYNNQPLLQLNFSGGKEDNYFGISITDQSGLVLYSNNVRGEHFTKQFLLNTEDLADAVLTFEITSRKTGKTVAYKVSRQRKTTEQMDVVKL